MDKPPNEETIDTGEPIRALQTLAPEEPKGFIDRLRKKIDRRIVTNEFVSAGWEIPGQVIREFLEFIFQLFAPADADKDKGVNDEGSPNNRN